MDRNAKIHIAGHRGIVGSALMRNLLAKGYENLLTRTLAELDLTYQAAVETFFDREKPDYVFLAAANNTYPAEFIRGNLAIQTNIIHAAYTSEVKRLLFLGTSGIYPKLAPQPMREETLLSGPLEPTNRPYTLAKIAGIDMRWSYNRQYSAHYLAIMSTNLCGPDDNYYPGHSTVINAPIRKFHDAKTTNAPTVTVWGSGTRRRDFHYSEDMADACVFLMNLPNGQFDTLLGSDETVTGLFMPPVVSIGVGEDLTIAELARLVKQVLGLAGEIAVDDTKPDSTRRKPMDVGLLHGLGWRAREPLTQGLQHTYSDYLNQMVQA